MADSAAATAHPNGILGRIGLGFLGGGKEGRADDAERHVKLPRWLNIGKPRMIALVILAALVWLRGDDPQIMQVLRLRFLPEIFAPPGSREQSCPDRGYRRQ